MILESQKRKVKVWNNIIDRWKKRSINFGSNVSKTFVEGATLEKRNNYSKRHSVNEIWNKINPGSLSAGILWGDSNDIKENLKEYMKKINIK